MSFYYDLDNSGGTHLYHDCPMKYERQVAPSLRSVLSFGFYEDGYFRGLRRGTNPGDWFRQKDIPYAEHVIRCKACGEEVVLNDEGDIV